MLVEVTNALHRRVIKDQLSLESASELLDNLIGMNIELYETPQLHHRALELASQLQQGAAYDSHYLALAETLDCELWTADERFHRVAESLAPNIHWLGELVILKLELHTYEVDDVQFSSETRLSGRTLNIDRQAIVDMVSEDGHFSEVEIHLVRPGDEIRLINVLDVVEPRHKVSGPGSIFPGSAGPSRSVWGQDGPTGSPVRWSPCAANL